MKSLITAKTQTQWIAGIVAVMATTLSAGSPLILAEHYARSGASWEASGYYDVKQARGDTCREDGKLRAEVTVPLRKTDNS